jgi:hypothetical protein
MTAVFNVGRFNALLGVARPGLGQHVTWQKSFLCPCRSPTSGAAQQGCPVCAGRGVAWDGPVPAWTGLAGMKIAREWALFGEWMSGDLVVTIPSDSPLYAVGENDRVNFTDSSEPFSSVLMGGVDVLAFPATVIDRVVWRDQITRQIVPGGIPSEAANGTLTWTSGAPPAGVQYSISGRRIPQYFMFKELVQDRHHSGGLALPRRSALRRWDLFGR